MAVERRDPIALQPFDRSQLSAVVDLSLRAWAPVFDSMREAMLPAVFEAFFKGDWRATQQAAVEAVCADSNMHVSVAIAEGQVAGFVALRLHASDRMGEIYMIAVDPNFQRRGIAGELTRYSLQWLKDKGMSIAMVETGGDPGHAPARRAYESAGFQLLPVARYFKSL